MALFRVATSSLVRSHAPSAASLRICPASALTASVRLGPVRAFKYSAPQGKAGDYYDLLQYPLDQVPQNGWQIDSGALKRRWREQMALTHPDRLANRSESEQRQAAQHSSAVNKAYETLMNPLARALYLLEVQGAEGMGESDSIEDPVLLMEVMELQEALDAAEDEEAVQAVAAANDEHLQGVLARLGDAFAKNPPDTDAVRTLATELRYWDNIARAAREWQPDAS